MINIPEINQEKMLTDEYVTIIKEEAKKIAKNFAIGDMVGGNLINLINFYKKQLQIDEVLDYINDISETAKILKENIEKRINKDLKENE